MDIGCVEQQMDGVVNILGKKRWVKKQGTFIWFKIGWPSFDIINLKEISVAIHDEMDACI
jgi:hypothetical protein